MTLRSTPGGGDVTLLKQKIAELETRLESLERVLAITQSGDVVLKASGKLELKGVTIHLN